MARLGLARRCVAWIGKVGRVVVRLGVGWAGLGEARSGPVRRGKFYESDMGQGPSHRRHRKERNRTSGKNLEVVMSWKALECFGVGLVSVAGFLVLICLLFFLAFRVEAPVESWFLRHPKVSKGVVIGGWTLMACGVISTIFVIGCAIMGAK